MKASIVPSGNAYWPPRSAKVPPSAPKRTRGRGMRRVRLIQWERQVDARQEDAKKDLNLSVFLPLVFSCPPFSCLFALSSLCVSRPGHFPSTAPLDRCRRGLSFCRGSRPGCRPRRRALRVGLQRGPQGLLGLVAGDRSRPSSRPRLKLAAALSGSAFKARRSQASALSLCVQVGVGHGEADQGGRRRGARASGPSVQRHRTAAAKSRRSMSNMAGFGMGGPVVRSGTPWPGVNSAVARRAICAAGNCSASASLFRVARRPGRPRRTDPHQPHGIGRRAEQGRHALRRLR